MAKAQIVRSAPIVLLLLLLGAFATRGDLRGSTLANAFISAKDQKVSDASAAAAALAVREATKSAAGQLYAEGKLSFNKLQPLPPEFIDEETLWLARCIFSETKRPMEQELVAWVVRNRVETAYRGRTSFREVVLDPMQFSAFNPASRKRQYYMGLTPESRATGWQTALRIAHDVRWSNPETWRPFSPGTRHFYSEQSMVGQRHPEWASGFKPVTPEREYQIEARRFRFYEGVN